MIDLSLRYCRCICGCREVDRYPLCGRCQLAIWRRNAGKAEAGDEQHGDEGER